PRYATATGTDPIDAAIDGDALNPPHVLNVPYGISMEVDVALGRELMRVTSPSHAIQVLNGDEGIWRVTFAGGLAEMDRDVVLLLDLKREHAPAVQAAPGHEGGTYLAVTLVPEFDETEPAERKPAETIFVLDCSGSMQGESIAQATAALELCLRSMSMGDTFNICRFGSTWDLLASESLVYSPQTFERAIQHVRRGADLGGTELYPPLEAILSVAPRAGTVRNVILLTDGQVSNEPAVIELARKYRAHNRIFSFGIGAAASAFLVKGVARATGGAAEFISAGERIDDKVLRTFGRIASPPVSDVSIDWDGCDMQTLAELPPVFDGDVLAVFGRAPGRVPARVTLRCNTPTGPRSWSVNVPPAREDEGTIATMWARRTIQSLEEVNGSARGRLNRGRKSREAEMLISLSRQFGLLCSLTTFIAIEHRSPAERNAGEPALRRVPVMLADGWGGVLGETCDKTMDRTMDRLRDSVRDTAPASPGLLRKLFGGSRSELSTAQAEANARARLTLSTGKMYRESYGKSVPAGASTPPPDRVDFDKLLDEELSLASPAGDDGRASGVLTALSLQFPDGSFGWSPVLTGIFHSVGLDADAWRGAVEREFPGSKGSKNSGDVASTVAIVLLLTLHFADQQPLWQRAVRKATREFLVHALGKNVAEIDLLLEGLKPKLPPVNV
ncbi:MAG TPA: VWA domain-containing protein, partial [Tepidisphaeraceae bacterium]|nr:VWA domain-containing protein [Tepidisphaeraceae bacterium]